MSQPVNERFLTLVFWMLCPGQGAAGNGVCEQIGAGEPQCGNYRGFCLEEG